VIFEAGTDKIYKNVLVPLSGGPNCAFALEVTTILADKEEGKVVAFNVDTGKYKFNIKEFIHDKEKQLNLPSGKIEAKTIKSKKILDTILTEIANYDLVVVGATGKSVAQHFWMASLPEKIAEECQKPIAMVKAKGGIRSWIKQWI